MCHIADHSGIREARTARPPAAVVKEAFVALRAQIANEYDLPQYQRGAGQLCPAAGRGGCGYRVTAVTRAAAGSGPVVRAARFPGRERLTVPLFFRMSEIFAEHLTFTEHCGSPSCPKFPQKPDPP